METVDPNETLYIQNLNEKIKSDEMRVLLYQLFAQYGTVLEVQTQKQYRMRGQAFVVYDSKEDATNAMRLLQGYSFHGKTLRISYSKVKSDIITKREGTYIPRDHTESSFKRQHFFRKLEEKQAKRRGMQIEMPSNGHAGANHILFIERIDSSIPENVIASLFSLYKGYKEVRMIPEKRVAFIEFDEDFQAAKALEGLNGYKITENCQLIISYAKR
ncbi:SNRPA [Blepharisma stoltei]|uniref:RRM domain-containing protein n=1 Tax=Blepharisma stoltei TaxID=1481888 RepID=A0AAU9JMJ1_9CILI|nr:unnamed protein product [Blepharisma stoltei]